MSVGIISPNIWNNKNVPNHQPDIWLYDNIMIIAKSHHEMIINLDPLFILHVAHCPNAQTQRTSHQVW